MATRSPEEIRASIEANRAELAVSLGTLRDEVAELADWRKQLQMRQKEATVAAAVAGFVVGGGIAALGGILTYRRRHRRR